MQSGEDPIAYLRTMWKCASVGGLLPEQVWDAAPIPALGLEPGRPSGSAMPLLWAHAEFLKLLIAREQRRPIELLSAVEQRYLSGAADQYAARAAAAWHWRDEVPVLRHEAGRALLIEDRRPFTLHFGFDGWQRVEERAAEAKPFGLWSVRLSAAELSAPAQLNFTRRYEERWEGVDHRVPLGHAGQQRALSSFG